MNSRNKILIILYIIGILLTLIGIIYHWLITSIIYRPLSLLIIIGPLLCLLSAIVDRIIIKTSNRIHHPELKKNEIFIGNYTEKNFSKVGWPSKRKGTKAYEQPTTT